MINVKASAAAAGAAFILSLLLGLLSGAVFWVAFFRALAFGAVFFVLVSGAWFLITRFLPELLESPGSRGDPNAAGSRVNISLDDGDPFAMDGAASPVMAGEAAPGLGDELGDISAFGDAGEGFSPAGAAAPGKKAEFLGGEAGGPSAGLDQDGQDGYTQKGLEEENPFGELLSPSVEPDMAAAGAGSAASDGDASLPELAGADEPLPDLDAMAGAFNSTGGLEGEPEEKSSPRRPSAGGKPTKVEGDFNPKDMAAAIRDRLKRE